MAVLPVLEGDLLDVDLPSHVGEAGRMLATVHDALAGYPHRVGAGKSAAGQQLLHMDFRSANLLHDGTRISAVLDWERVTYGTRIADLAHAAVLLGTRYHDWAPTREDVRQTFIDAYSEQSPLTSAERQELSQSIDAVLKEMGWLPTGT
ncbi:MAG TPA: phosphotransferase [Mycobacteriales bacterium]|nr:phosphotransferase [Mycobacteriales bacterium]